MVPTWLAGITMVRAISIDLCARITFVKLILILVTLASPDGTPFLGFVIQARDASNNLTGSFMVLDSSNSELLNCPGNGAATVSGS